MTLLGIALSLVCAWSQAHCQMASQVALRPMPSLAFEIGALSYPGTIQYSQKIEHPEVLAVILSGELQHRISNDTDAPNACVSEESNANRAMGSQWLWFTKTFGRPDTTGMAYDARYIREFDDFLGGPNNIAYWADAACHIQPTVERIVNGLQPN